MLELFIILGMLEAFNTTEDRTFATCCHAAWEVQAKLSVSVAYYI